MNKNAVLLELLREINRESEAKDVMRACKIAASTIEALQAEIDRLKSEQQGEMFYALCDADKCIKKVEAQAVPEGFVVVPVEPTEAMYYAFDNGRLMSLSLDDEDNFYDGYATMIQAAREDE